MPSGAAQAARWVKTCRELQREAFERASGITDAEEKLKLL